MKRIQWVTILLLLLFSSVCMAQQKAQLTYGMLVNDSYKVLAVNLYGPAYMKGIQPGAQIADLKQDDSIVIDMKEALAAPSKKPLTFLFRSDRGFSRVDVIPERLTAASEISTFLVLGDQEEIYERILDVLASDKEISPLFAAVNEDSNHLTVTTAGRVTQKEVQDFPTYFSTIGNRGFGFEQLEARGTFAVEDMSDTDFCKVTISLQYRANWKHLFGKTWESFPSTGVLENKIIGKICGI